MELTSKKFIKDIFRKYDIQPSKKLGQNFLINKSAIIKLIESLELKNKDIVFEIGPGIGTLTKELALKAKLVIAIEKDPKMCEILKETLKEFDNIKIIKQDILKLDIASYKLGNYKLTGNLPFYLTAPVIRKFLESSNQPERINFMIQKEVGQRICAKPPKMSILAISTQFYAKTKMISYLSKRSFWPEPKVNACIIKISPFKKKLIEENLIPMFFEIVKMGFAHPRKQLINNLSSKTNKRKVKDWLLKNKINPNQRAETLEVNDWINLLKSKNELK